MVDLYGQYQKIQQEIDTAIQEVVEDSAFVRGKAVCDFEKNLAQYLEIHHVVSCASGTDALTIALMALDLHPEDEVITTPFTFFATAEAIAFLGLRPVFVDVCPDTYNMDVSQIESAVTSRTRAILPVHLFGQCAEMEPILEVARRHQFYVIEDACQSLGAEYTFSDGRKAKAGTMGDIGCTSFFPSKNLGCFGDGGALFIRDENLASRVRRIANHGSSCKYHHDEIGMNSRLDTIQAAVLNVKLRYLDDYNAARQQAAALYTQMLQDCSSVELPIQAAFSSHIFHQYTLRLCHVDRDGVQNSLREAGIPTMVYYPIPCHLQKAMASLGYLPGSFPVAEQLSSQVLSLPMHTELTISQQQKIIHNLKIALSQHRCAGESSK